MGVKTTSKVWEWSKAQGTDRLVMLALADFCDDCDECFPGIARIAKKCAVSERTVQRSFRSLEDLGELMILEKMGMKTNGGATNRFRLVLKGGDKQGQPSTKGGDKQGAKVVTNRAKGGDTAMSPEPSGEPSVNHQLRASPKPLKVVEEKKSKGRATHEEVKTFFRELNLPQDDADWFYYKCEGNGWKNGGTSIKDWKLTVRSWVSAKYLPSLKANGRGQPYTPPPSKRIASAKEIEDALMAQYS